ncbi:MAG: type I-MYXAN CRISPR-associated protein Cas5/Cmx5/DevS [Xenococcaceae cyanobacterium MO_188.B32]|nr:type I-MYXAN CRISPR-associated protein Cas5/Cmx5/DevS [Xenococcaceae cyanobacterium MO_188.B32]
MIFLEISAPFASFKHSYSREYAGSYSYPPPSTIYGCLLSLVGETDMQYHQGVKIAISLCEPAKLTALASKPQTSIVMRTVRRLKNADLNRPSNSKPDFQEILSAIKIIVGVDSSEDTNNLESRIIQALTSPETIERFGGLSLGESRDLINDIQIIKKPSASLQWLTKNTKGKIKLPLIVDYLGSKNTKMEKFSLNDFSDRTFFSIN